MNHKKDFLEWKESTFTEICDNLSDVVCTDRKLNVGDKVIFKNKHGIKFGPFEVIRVFVNLIMVEDVYFWTRVVIGSLLHLIALQS